MIDNNTEQNLNNVRNLTNYSHYYTPFSNNPSNIAFLNIASHNIQKAYNKKLSDIITNMMIKNIHILHICETDLIRTSTEATYDRGFEKHTYKINNHINPNITHEWYIINNLDPKYHGSGNAFILSLFIYKHLSKITTIKECYIKITLTFKECNNFQIIGVYIPHKNSKNIDYNDTLQLFQESLHKDISLTYNNKQKFIILGDFNINPYLRTISIKQKKFLSLFKNFFLKDIHKHFFIKPPNTFKSHNASTRIDLIFASQNVIDKIISASVITPIYSSDHSIVSIKIDTPFISKNSIHNLQIEKNNQLKKFKKPLNTTFQSLSEYQWLQFQTSITIKLNFLITDNPNFLQNTVSIGHFYDHFYKYCITL
jgi:exonuclease III